MEKLLDYFSFEKGYSNFKEKSTKIEIDKTLSFDNDRSWMFHQKFLYWSEYYTNGFGNKYVLLQEHWLGLGPRSV